MLHLATLRQTGAVKLRKVKARAIFRALVAELQKTTSCGRYLSNVRSSKLRNNRVEAASIG